ncbi:MAG: nucleotidyltransferase domain-containing protein [Lachnospiraceae bacterium]|nr:nucleotidyltransferase domain-containing protein [Lachnospiraceae bacterium]
MSSTVQVILNKYVSELEKIYGAYLKSVILYGSYARGDFTEESDIDIMILLDLDEMLIKKYRHDLSGITYDFNMDYDVDIKPIAKSREHFEKWEDIYPFYKNVKSEGVRLFGSA